MKYISESDAEKLFDDYLDEVTGDVVILGMSYNASRVLHELDPVAYNCCLADFLDSEGLTTDESEARDDDDDDQEELP